MWGFFLHFLTLLIKKIPRCEERRRKGEKRNATGNMFETKWKISTRLIQRFLKQSTKKVKRFFFWQLISHQKTKKNAVKTTY